jgi:nonribosomal peptide synthetase protein BlmIII
MDGLTGTNSTPTAATLLAPEQREVWQRINDTADGAASTTLCALLRYHIEADPQSHAVVAARRRLTYGELGASAAGVAEALRGSGSSSVVICVEPGWEQAVAVAAALMEGIPFQAIDPGVGQVGRWRVVTDLGATVVLTQSWLNDRLSWPDGTATVAVDATSSGTHRTPTRPAAPDSIACWLSPGTPGAAGVPLTHQAIAGPVQDLARRLKIGPADRFLAVSPLGDEVSLFSLLAPLLSGGAVVIPDDIDLHSPAAWVELIRRENVSIWHSTPALAGLLAEHVQARGDDGPDILRFALLAGEPVAVSLVDRLRRLSGSPLTVVNLTPGGPAALWSAYLEVGECDPRRGFVPAGGPLANVQAYVLNDALAPCPAWVAGHLHVGGPGLANHIDDDRVVTLPDSSQRLYRTQLIGRLLPAGVIEIVGDDAAQISVGGHPLNLREVEGHFALHPDVVCVAVVPAGDSSVAYVKVTSGAQLTGADLLDHVRRKMSPYLLPARVELVGLFPLTRAGTIDRAALMAMARNTMEPERTVAGRSDLSLPADLLRRACELAARVLGVSDVEENMNLLDLGATSVQLVRLAVQAEQELGIEVNVEELLAFPSVAVLVSFARAAQSPPPAEFTVDSSGDGELILDPIERVAFKDRQPGIRRQHAGPGIDLQPVDAQWREPAGRRRTQRTFGSAALPASALGHLLGAMGRLDAGGDDVTSLKYAYPSAGSLYPVQTYVEVRAGRIDGVAPGWYYYHPVDHRLVVVNAGAGLEDSAHAWMNRASARAAAFSVYLVACYDAITPLYGARARDYCLIEAGAMCQLVMARAAQLDVGVCPIGEMDVAGVRAALDLGDDQEIVHILLGGPMSTEGGV